MKEEIKERVIDYMKKHNICTLATIREDGFPQANTVEYVNDEITIYFATDPKSQKIKNIKFSEKVSLAIEEDYPDWMKIKGVQLGGTAEILTRKEEIAGAQKLYLDKFPFVKDFPPSDTVFCKVTPKTIYFLDYENGFGHRDVIEV